jgi:ABC-type multidrug transport system permease subunit
MNIINQSIALYDWNNGVIMIAVFGLICVALVVALLIFMSGGKKKEEE